MLGRIQYTLTNEHAGSWPDTLDVHRGFLGDKQHLHRFRDHGEGRDGENCQTRREGGGLGDRRKEKP